MRCWGRGHLGQLGYANTDHIGDNEALVQCASLVQRYSRMLYAQVHARWSRFECRAFLTEVIQYFGGAASRCIIDNSSVIIAHGRGPNAVPAAQMLALAERFGLKFETHAVGDANRSARVERPFHFIENNFYAAAGIGYAWSAAAVRWGSGQ